MQDTLYQTTDAGVSLSESGCRSLSIRRQMQESLYQTADEGDTLSDSGCRSLSIRQRMQDSLYQTADTEVSLPQSDRVSNIRCLIERLLHTLADRVSPASSG